LELAAALGGTDRDAGRRVSQPHPGGGLVAVLTARAASDEERHLALPLQGFVVEPEGGSGQCAKLGSSGHGGQSLVKGMRSVSGRSDNTAGLTVPSPNFSEMRSRVWLSRLRRWPAGEKSSGCQGSEKSLNETPVSRSGFGGAALASSSRAAW